MRVSREMLYQKCIVEQKSLTECAKVFGISLRQIYKACHTHDIEIRPHGSVVNKAKSRPRVSITHDWLYNAYVTEGKDVRECAALVGCSGSTIWHKLREFDIPLRPRGGATRSDEWRAAIADQSRIDIPQEQLYQLYVVEARSAAECARHFGCGETAVLARLQEYGIPRRTSGPPIGTKFSDEARRRMSETRKGPNNGNWRGGIASRPYCPKFNSELKESVRDSFDRTCYLCGEKENGRKLHIHHVDYNKGQGCGAKWSLIPLCHRCHMRTNGPRWYWFSKLANYWVSNPEINFEMPF